MLSKILTSSLVALTLALPSTTSFAAQNKAVSAARAANYMGQKIMACGKLAQVKQIKNGHFLNLDAPYPHQSLTVVIWKNEYKDVVKKLGDLEDNVGKVICAFGTVSEYKKDVQIVVKKAQNIDYAR